MVVLKINPKHPEPELIDQAARLIERGELVAFPTETVYGLGANALNADAVARIYEAKGRPAWNPVIVHVASIEGARRYASDWPESAQLLAEEFWPGPLTLVVPRTKEIPDVVTAGGPTVALRVPAHPIALALITASGCPIAAPSANRYTKVSPTTAAHVAAGLGDRVSLILDGGRCSVGIESTVVECGSDVVTILRPGMIDRDTIASLPGMGTYRVLSKAERRPHDSSAAGLGIEFAIGNDTGDSAKVPRSPGTADRHYAPQGEVWLFTPDWSGDAGVGGRSSGQAELERALREERQRGGSGDGERGLILGLLRTASFPGGGDLMEVIAMPDDPVGYARQLYAALHEADERRASVVVIEMPPDTEIWRGVRDRLTRAAR